MTERPNVPTLFVDFTQFVNRWPYSPLWKRMRIAMTREELEEFKAYIIKDKMTYTQDRTFAHALRGIPIIIEEQPDNYGIVIEQANV